MNDVILGQPNLRSHGFQGMHAVVIRIYTKAWKGFQGLELSVTFMHKHTVNANPDMLFQNLLFYL